MKWEESRDARDLGCASRALSGNREEGAFVDRDGLDRAFWAGRKGQRKGIQKKMNMESIKSLCDMSEIEKIQWATLCVEMVVLVVKVKLGEPAKKSG